MQLNNTELRFLESAIPTQSLPTFFQLPALHESVPRTARVVQYKTDFSALGRNLLDAGVIDPADIPDDVVAPQQVVAEGLNAWVMRRIGKLQYMRFDIELLDAESAKTEVEHPDYNGQDFTGPSLAFRGNTADLRFVEDIARQVEKSAPGLFLAAFSELVAASYRTVEVQHPERILEGETSYSLWGNDIHSVKDDEARQELIDRFGEEDDEHLDRYMPEAILEAYGNGFCFSMTTKARPAVSKKKRPRFPNWKLRKLSRTGNKKVAAIAKGLLGLRRAAQRVKQLDARLHGIEGLRCYWVACILLFNNDDRCSQYMDQEGQYLWDNGEGTELHTLEQLPESASDLATYFNKLDALLDLVSQMDALIPSISYSAYAE